MGRHCTQDCSFDSIHEIQSSGPDAMVASCMIITPWTIWVRFCNKVEDNKRNWRTTNTPSIKQSRVRSQPVSFIPSWQSDHPVANHRYHNDNPISFLASRHVTSSHGSAQLEICPISKQAHASIAVPSCFMAYVPGRKLCQLKPHQMNN